MILGSFPLPVVDWSFVESQERFILESVGVQSAYRSLSPQSRMHLECMGSRDWQVRDAASFKMTESGDVRACFVGQYLGDPEVKLRCRNVLRRLSSCGQCEGKGGKQESWGIATCGYCRGVGHFWPVDDY